MRVTDVAHRATEDIDPDKGVDAKGLDGLVRRSVLNVTDALQRPASPLTEIQRLHVSEIIQSLGYTHATIRDVLRHGTESPIPADSLPLTRMQVETLYTLCLMLEKPEYISVYLKHSWRQVYAQHLLHMEECGHLPRFSGWINNRSKPLLEKLQGIAGITDEDRASIEFDELGKPLPAGMSYRAIVQLPTPKRTIRLIQHSPRRRMLERLYPEYQVLSSYVHGASTQFRLMKTLLNPRSKYRRYFSSGEIELMFQKISEEAIWLSYLSIVQSCSEVVGVYPTDVDLRASLASSWAPLIEGSLVGRAIWEIRTRALLGAVN